MQSGRYVALWEGPAFESEAAVPDILSTATLTLGLIKAAGLPALIIAPAVAWALYRWSCRK